MPRSPRATITASAASAISSRSAIAAAGLDLGDDVGAVADDLAHAEVDVGAGAHERQGDELDAGAGDGLGSTRSRSVGGEHLQPLAREVDAGTTLGAATALDLGHDGVPSADDRIEIPPSPMTITGRRRRRRRAASGSRR